MLALFAAQNTADDGAARHGAGIIAAAYRDAACRRKADDAACAAFSQQHPAGIIGHRALIGTLVQCDGHAAVACITDDAAHASRPARIDCAGIDTAFQLCTGGDKANDAALTTVTTGAAQIVSARLEGGINTALIPAIRDLMDTAAGETAYQTAHRGALRPLIVDEGDGDIYLRHAIADGHAATLTAAQQAADDIARHVAVIGADAGQIDIASYCQVLNDRILRYAEQAQLLAAAQRRDIQAGHRVALSVKGAGIGTLAIAAEDTDNRPLAVAKVDIRRQHRAVSCALHLVIHRVGQPCQLLRRADLVGLVLCALTVGLAGGNAVPAVLGTGRIQQLFQLAAGGGIGLLDSGEALLPRLLDGGVVGQVIQLHRCRRFNGGFAALQCVSQQLLTLLIEAADIAQLRRQLRDALLRQCIQLLPRRFAGLLQRRRCRRIHVRRRLALREGGRQVGQRLSGIRGKDIHFFGGSRLIQLQLPALIGGQQRGHVLLRILFIGDEFVIEILLCLLRIGNDLNQLAILT